MSGDDPLDALAERAAAGDAAAVDALIAEHVPMLQAYVRLRMGKRLTARESSADVVQSVCRELLSPERRFAWNGAPAFRAWLFTAALRKIADRAAALKAARRDVAREEPAVVVEQGEAFDRLAACYATVVSPSQVAIGHETLERVDAAFAALPDDYREVVTLSRLVGLDRAGVAQAMGRSEASVRNLLSRALARLATEIGRRGGV